MSNKPIQIKFKNSQNPKSAFDLIKMEDLVTRDNLNHSPFQFHIVEFYMLIIIEQSKGQHAIDFKDYDYEKGTILTIRKDQVHQFSKNTSVKGTILLFTDEFLVSFFEEFEALKALQLFNELLGVPKIQLSHSEYNEIDQLLERVKKEYFDINDEHSLGVIRSELHILVAKLYRIKSDNNQIIHNRKYLNEFVQLQNLVEKNANIHTKVANYAPLMALSTKTINTITRSIINKSAKEFINDIRTKQIKRLLINTELSIKEIAYESGFEESTNFYKYFKHQTGYTPEQFRHTHQ